MSIAYIDWGGTNFRCVVEGEEIVAFSKPSSDIDIVVELEELFRVFPHICRVGISFAGQTVDNRIVSAPNIKAKELDLGAYFGDSKKIFVQNDLKCALLAESAYHNEQNISVLYVGTGIGSAYMNDGRLVGGYANIAGEIGHIPYFATGELCGCGKDNCLELSASGSGLAKKAKMVGLDCHTLNELLESEAGANIVKEFVDGVGYAAALIITMLNPKLLVIGGGITLANEWMIDDIKEYVQKNAFKKSADMCEIRLSNLENGSLDGARLLAL